MSNSRKPSSSQSHSFFPHQQDGPQNASAVGICPAPQPQQEKTEDQKIADNVARAFCPGGGRGCE